MDHISEGLALLKSAQLLDQGIGRKGGPDRASQIKQLEDARDEFKAKYRVALGTIRMPKARSKDPKLIQIAKQVLKSGRYKNIHPQERIVVNADKKRHSKKTAYASGGVVTFYKYDWEEFQVTTAERMDEGYMLFYNTIRYYHQADPKTTTGKWILGNRIEGSRILKENIQK